MLAFDQLVVSELTRVTGQSCHGKTKIKIVCPFHNDHDPSLHVTVSGKYIGSYYCFACGASPKKNGGWNGLAEKLGMQTQRKDGISFISERRAPKIETAKYLEDDFAEGISEEDLMASFTPAPITKWRDCTEDDGWRGFDGDILTTMGAWKGIDGWGQRCTIFPVRVYGELVGGIKAKNKPPPKDRFKYVNMPGTWVKTTGLFGYDVALEMLGDEKERSIFLCEGPRSALRLTRMGIPAVAILGAYNWSEEKAALLLSMNLERVFTAFDGDDAGLKAARIVLPTLKGYVWRKRIDLPDGKDPFDMSDKYWERFCSKYDITPKPLPVKEME
jgi:hypothetical protein